MVTNIRELRRITGLSQKEFGKKYNIPLKTIQNWESMKDKTESRTCPSYVVFLLSKAIAGEYPDCKLDDRIDNLIAHGRLNLDFKRESALRYAIDRISESPLLPFVEDVVLYGSTARNEAKASSDIDLLLVLSPKVKDHEKYNSWIIRLKGNISTENFDEPETDLHVAFGSGWKNENFAYQKNVQEEGLSIWN